MNPRKFQQLLINALLHDRADICEPIFERLAEAGNKGEIDIGTCLNKEIILEKLYDFELFKEVRILLIFPYIWHMNKMKF